MILSRIVLYIHAHAVSSSIFIQICALFEFKGSNSGKAFYKYLSTSKFLKYKNEVFEEFLIIEKKDKVLASELFVLLY